VYLETETGTEMRAIYEEKTINLIDENGNMTKQSEAVIH
jgi:hypothetical protein